MIPQYVKNREKAKTISEGTWIPYVSTLEGATPTVTYISRYGSYKKIGNLVYVDFYIRGKITALTGTNNYGIIEGLPFKTSNKTLGTQGLTMNLLYGLIESATNAGLVFSQDNYHIRMQYNYGGAANKLKVTSSNYFEIGGNGWYTTP